MQTPNRVRAAQRRGGAAPARSGGVLGKALYDPVGRAPADQTQQGHLCDPPEGQPDHQNGTECSYRQGKSKDNDIRIMSEQVLDQDSYFEVRN